MLILFEKFCCIAVAVSAKSQKLNSAFASGKSAMETNVKKNSASLMTKLLQGLKDSYDWAKKKYIVSA